VSGAPLPPLAGSQRAFATVMLSLANFMVVLDMTIANVSVPHIAGSLAVSSSQGTWIITSYAVAEAIIVPLTGWLTHRFGTVRLFVSCILGFALASLLCAWSTSLAMLVAARVIQGLCGGPIMPLSQTLLLQSYPPEKSGQALGSWAVTTLLAPIAGPVLGGWISDNIAWEWIFYINLPVGIVGAAMIWSIYKSRESERVRERIDYVGLALLVVWVGCLQLVLDKGRELDWFGSPLIVGLALASAVAFGFFLIWEATDEKPVVDLRVFRNRNFTSGVFSLSIIFGTFFGYVVLLPLWLQSSLGYTALWAGLTLAPMGVFAILMAPVVGATLSRVDPRLYATFAVLVFATVFFWRTHLTPAPAFRDVMLPQLMVGLGLSTMFLPLTALAMAEIEPRQMAAAAGLQNFVRTLFGAFGTALSTSYWENGISRHHAALVENVTNYDPATREFLGGAEQVAGSGAGAALVDQLVNQQAAVLALRDFFLLGAVLVLLMSPLIWLARRPKGPVDITQAH
jgi:DHA2 family multidrug resistance protein